jgi:hypothetical protein
LKKINQARLKQLSIDTGKSEAELELIAAETGINLYDVTKNYSDIMKEFTGNIVKNKDQLNAALTDLFLAGANPFKKQRESEEARVAFNDIGAKISAIGKGGGTKKEKIKSINAQMEQLIPALLAAAGGDPMKAFGAYTKLFGADGKSGTAFGAGQQFEGMEWAFGADNAAMQESLQLITGGVAGELGTQVRSRLSAESGLNVDPELFTAAMKNMPADKLAQLQTDLGRMDENTIVDGRETNQLKRVIYGTDGKRKLNPEQQEAALKRHYGLEGFDITQTDSEAINKIANYTQAQKEATVGLTEAITLFNSNAETFMNTSLGGEKGPAWWQKGLVYNDEEKSLKPAADTSTSRSGRIGDTATSKLSQTMGRHAAMDGQLTGKRTITSSLRNHSLGSPSSDHATGAAYDLTGQNLGMYARMVHANGGFAEFHGTLGDRHLHVVPGPGLMGDTTSPRQTSAVMPGAAAGSNVTNYYTFEISGGDSDAIANKVMEKIRQAERSSRERA